jgi:hypothetical protein
MLPDTKHLSCQHKKFCAKGAHTSLRTEILGVRLEDLEHLGAGPHLLHQVIHVHVRQDLEEGVARLRLLVQPALRLGPGLAIKNPPKNSKKTPKKKQNNHIKKPNKNVFWGFL